MFSLNDIQQLGLDLTLPFHERLSTHFNRFWINLTSCCQVYETGNFINLQYIINWQFHLAFVKELTLFSDMLGYTDKYNI